MNRGCLPTLIALGLLAAAMATGWTLLVHGAEPEVERGRNGGYLGLFLREKDGAIVVERVQPKSGAEKAGFKAGDVIQTVNGRRPRNGDMLLRMFWSRRPLELGLKRGTEELTIRTSTRALDAVPKVGGKAPPFSLPSKDGKSTYALKDLLAKKKPVVLVFGSFT